jgi:hypothetical protein
LNNARKLTAMRRERRTEMRCQKLGLSLLTFLSLAALPLPGQALVVRLCTPVCEGLLADTTPVAPGVNEFTSLPAQTSTLNGVTTTSLPVSVTYNGFVVSGTITSQQSGTLQRIVFNPTVITAPSSGCSLTTPCRFEILATSQPTDFPIAKPAGGFPAGAFMSGKFEGLGNGDTISSTGESSGLSADFTPVSTDVINLTPATGGANVGTTLPNTCSGNLGCKFTSSAFRRSFWTELSETVQQECGVNFDGVPIQACLTRLRTKVTLEIKTNNNRVTLPFSHEKHNISAADEAQFRLDGTIPATNPVNELIKTAIVPLGDLDINSLFIGNNNFSLTAKLKLASGAEIDPSIEETYFSIGNFSLLILPDRFKNVANGRQFVFTGKVDGLDVTVHLTRDRADPTLWAVALGAHGVQLHAPQPSDPQVAVRIGIGSDSGTDLVTPKVIPPQR